MINKWCIKFYWRGRCLGDECGDDKDDERDTRESLDPVFELFVRPR